MYISSMTPPLELIPVLDLLNAQVVRGVRGERHAYQPIESALCRSSDPEVLARRLCEYCAARRLYVADLNGIMYGNAQREVLLAVLAAVPAVEVLLDAGFADVGTAAGLLASFPADEARRVTPVFGSESLNSLTALAEITEGAGPLQGRGILSLDRRGAQDLDSAGCWRAPQLWPETVIVMTLERVGADSGPALDTVAAVRAQTTRGTVIGAGGIRHADDLAQAARVGADAWLVASALHDGRLPLVTSQ